MSVRGMIQESPEVKAKIKIQKCCAQADGAQTQGEYDAAANRARKLIQEYGINPAEIPDQSLYDGQDFTENSLLKHLRDEFQSQTDHIEDDELHLDEDNKEEDVIEDINKEDGMDDDEDADEDHDDNESALFQKLHKHWEVTPWGKKVDGNELVNELKDKIRKHVVITDEQLTTVAFWVLQTWVHEKAARYSPILVALSPEPNSGKTTLLDVIKALSHRGTMSINASPAAIVQLTHHHKPTLILDEADKAFIGNKRLAEIFNGGWTRDAFVYRAANTKDKRQNLKARSVFSPKALGMIGLSNMLNDTATRVIPILCKPKLPFEQVVGFDPDGDITLDILRSKAKRWANDNYSLLAGAEVVMPDGFNNRLASNWKLMFTIADLIGHGKGKELRKAAVKVEAVKQEMNVSQGIYLLRDIKTIIEDRAAESESTPSFVRSSMLAEELLKLPESRWIDVTYGSNQSEKIDRLQRKVIPELLGRYETGKGGFIKPKQKRVRDMVLRGYYVADLQDAFERHTGGRV